MSAIDEVFFNCSHEGRAAFIPFLMAGDPDLDATGAYMEALAAGGADIIELGVPFTDPLADGPSIQAANERALAAGDHQVGVVLAVVAADRRAGHRAALSADHTSHRGTHRRGRITVHRLRGAA